MYTFPEKMYKLNYYKDAAKSKYNIERFYKVAYLCVNICFRER